MGPILIISPDDFVHCPTCNSRLHSDESVVDIDEDGPIFEGRCPQGHGFFKFQIEEE
jgi:hypothetical protein